MTVSIMIWSSFLFKWEYAKYFLEFIIFSLLMLMVADSQIYITYTQNCWESLKPFVSSFQIFVSLFFAWNCILDMGNKLKKLNKNYFYWYTYKSWFCCKKAESIVECLYVWWGCSYMENWFWLHLKWMYDSRTRCVRLKLRMFSPIALWKHNFPLIDMFPLYTPNNGWWTDN